MDNKLETIGNSLKTIFAKFQQVNADTGEVNDDFGKTIKTLEQLGVTTGAVTGELLPVGQILQNLASKWDTLSTKQQQMVATTLGERQISRFSAIMQGMTSKTGELSRQQQIYQEVMNSSGETSAQYEEYLDSLSGSLGRLEAQWEILFNNGLNSSTLKIFVDLATSTLKVADNIGILRIAIFTLTNILLLSNKAFKSWLVGMDVAKIKSFANTFSLIPHLFKTIGIEGNITSAKLLWMGTTIDLLKLKTIALQAGITMGLSLAITTVISLFTKWIGKSQELSQANKELLQTFNQNTKTNNDFINYLQQEGKAYDSLKDKTNLTKEEQEKLAQIKEKLTQQFPELIQGYDSEGKAILDTSKSAKDYIEILKQKNKLENDKVILQGDDILKEKYEKYQEYSNKIKSLQDDMNGGTETSSGNIELGLNNKIAEAKERQAKAIEKYGEGSKQVIQATEQLTQLEGELAMKKKEISVEQANQKALLQEMQPLMNAIFNNSGLNEFQQKLANVSINPLDFMANGKLDTSTLITQVQQFKQQIENDPNYSTIQMIAKMENPSTEDIKKYFDAITNLAKTTNISPLELSKLMPLKVDNSEIAKVIDSYIKEIESQLRKSNIKDVNILKEKLGNLEDLKVSLGIEVNGNEDIQQAEVNIENLDKAYQNATNSIKDYTNYLKEMRENGKLSAETIAEIISKHGELIPYLDNEKLLYKKIEEAVESEKNNAINATMTKLQNSEVFFSSMVQRNRVMFDNITNAYQLDLANFKTVAQVKQEIDTLLCKNLANNWLSLYGSQANAIKALRTSLTNQFLDFHEGLNDGYDLEKVEALQKIEGYVKVVEQMEKSIESAKNSLKSASFKTADLGKTPSLGSSSGSSKSPSSSGSSKSSSSSSKSSQTYTFNGAEVDEYQSQLQTVEDSLQKIDDKISEINQLKSNAESIDSESNYSEILKIQNQLLDEQINKQNTLNSKHDEVSELKNTIKEDIWKNWGKLRGKDLSKFTQTDWDDYLTQFYGKDRTFKNEADKKRYDVGMKLFQQLVKDYQDTTNKLNEIDDERLKQVEVVNNAIKDKWEAQINVYNDVFNKQSKDIDELSTRLDFANRSDESSIRNRLDIMYELISKKEENLRQIYKTRDELLEQQKSLKEGNLEWDLINNAVETYNANIKDATNSLLDQKDILSQSIQEMTDTTVSMYDKVYNALVKKYDKEKEDELDKIDDELKASTENEDGLIKYYNAKITNLKAELDRLKDETKDEQDILNAKKSELELWKKDDSIFAQGKIQELEKDIADKEKDLKIKAKEQELKEEEEKLKDVTESYDKRKEEKEKYYDNTLKDEKKLHEETRKIMQGGQDEILNLLYKYDERYASLGELLGSSFTNPFLEELEKAKKALEDLKLINKEIEQEKIKESLKTSTVVNVSNNGKTANMSDGSKVDLGGLYSNSEYRALGQKWLDAKESGDTASAQKYEQQARDYASKYASFDTGGMTGSWGGEGKLAVLHEKELILNKTDTENMLKALNVSQSLVDTFKNIVMPNIANNISFKLPDISKLTSKPLNTYNSPLVENKIYMTNNTPFEVDNNMDNMNRAIVKQLGLAGVNTPL